MLPLGKSPPRHCVCVFGAAVFGLSVGVWYGIKSGGARAPAFLKRQFVSATRRKHSRDSGRRQEAAHPKTPELKCSVTSQIISFVPVGTPIISYSLDLQIKIITGEARSHFGGEGVRAKVFQCNSDGGRCCRGRSIARSFPVASFSPFFPRRCGRRGKGDRLGQWQVDPLVQIMI